MKVIDDEMDIDWENFLFYITRSIKEKQKVILSLVSRGGEINFAEVTKLGLEIKVIYDLVRKYYSECDLPFPIDLEIAYKGNSSGK